MFLNPQKRRDKKIDKILKNNKNKIANLEN